MLLISFTSGYCFNIYGIDLLFPFDCDLSQYFFYRILSLLYIVSRTKISVSMTLVVIKKRIFLKFMGMNRIFRRHTCLRDRFRIFSKNNLADPNVPFYVST